MECKRCVFPGSFDPVTKGHLDLIERAAAIFDEVIVAVLHNPSKTGRFPMGKRLELLEKACAHLPNVCFDSFEGLLADYVRQCGAKAVLRSRFADVRMEDDGIRVYDVEDTAAIVDHLMKNGHVVSELKKNKIGLEEYYIELMSAKEEK